MAQVTPKIMSHSMVISAFAVLLLWGLCVCASAAGPQGQTLEEKLTGGGKTLTTVTALNHARQYLAEVFPGQTCRIFSGSTLHRLSPDDVDPVQVQYRPSLVFLSTGKENRGELMNVWLDFRTPGRPAGFCPAGTRFTIDSRTLGLWESSRGQLVLYERRSPDGLAAKAWVLRDKLADIGGD